MIRAIFRTRIGRAVEFVAEFAHDLVNAVVADRMRKRLGIDHLEHAYWNMHDRIIALEQARLDDEAKRKAEDERPAAKLAREMREGRAVFVSHEHEWVTSNNPRIQICNRCPAARLPDGSIR